MAQVTNRIHVLAGSEQLRGTPGTTDSERELAKFGGRHVEAGELGLTYLEAGNAPITFVLLHGSPASSRLWRDVIESRAPIGRCVMPDLALRARATSRTKENRS